MYVPALCIFIKSSIQRPCSNSRLPDLFPLTEANSQWGRDFSSLNIYSTIIVAQDMPENFVIYAKYKLVYFGLQCLL